jgi:hypothetical protein
MALADALRRRSLPEFTDVLSVAQVEVPLPPDASARTVVEALVQGIQLGLQPQTEVAL